MPQVAEAARASWTLASARDRFSPSVDEAGSRKAELERGADEALLGAVVEVAFDALSLCVGRVDDPALRGPDVGEASAAHGCEPHVLEREHGGRGQRRENLDRHVAARGDIQAERRA